MSRLTASTVRTLRPQAIPSNVRAANPLGPVPVPPPAPAPQEIPGKTHDLDVIGPRKLIRPTLPGSALRQRRFQRQDQPALIMRSVADAPASESSHAEAFYLQKQVQAQTPMVIVLDDGEKIEGSIEWYDRNVIKLRVTSSSPFRGSRQGESSPRILVYKPSIKYLYKAGENQQL